MSDVFLLAVWYFLPAGMGNMTPVLVAKMPLLKKWNAPLDAGKTWRGKPLFGPHKTWRGLICGVIAGAFVGFLQQQNASLIDGTGLAPDTYTGAAPIILGALLAFGALAGDAIESMIKRQVGVASGDSWFPFDQTDYIIGACLLGAFIVTLPVIVYVAILIVWFGLHLISSYFGYLIGLKAKPI